MKTQIFKSYSDFLAREDKEINGVSEVFAAEHPTYEKENETNKACYRCHDCSDCYGCYRCHDCYGCHDCSDCSDCSDKKAKDDTLLIPIISNIHSKILKEIFESYGTVEDDSEKLKAYAKQCAEQALKDAAERADASLIYHDEDQGEPSVEVDLESILNTPINTP